MLRMTDDDDGMFDAAEGIADSVAGSVAESDFTEFKSQKQGYTVKIPSAWEQKEKAGMRSKLMPQS